MTLRREKKSEEKTVKPKFAEERQETLSPLVPLNPLQAQYINYINTQKDQYRSYRHAGIRQEHRRRNFSKNACQILPRYRYSYSKSGE